MLCNLQLLNSQPGCRHKNRWADWTGLGKKRRGQGREGMACLCGGQGVSESLVSRHSTSFRRCPWECCVLNLSTRRLGKRESARHAGEKRHVNSGRTMPCHGSPCCRWYSTQLYKFSSYGTHVALCSKPLEHPFPDHASCDFCPMLQGNGADDGEERRGQNDVDA